MTPHPIYPRRAIAQTVAGKASGSPAPLTPQSKRSLAALLESLTITSDDLAKESRNLNWDAVDALVPRVKSQVRSIKKQIPKGMAKAELTELDQHSHLAGLYAGRQDMAGVLGNIESIRPDIENLRSALGIGGDADVRESIEALPPGAERELLEEAVRCLDAESARGAVVVGVCALENLLRDVHESTAHKDSKNLKFYEIINEVVEIKGLGSPEKAILDLCREFRNFAAHPSTYTHTMAEARAIIILAAEQVRKWKTGGASGNPSQREITGQQPASTPRR